MTQFMRRLAITAMIVVVPMTTVRAAERVVIAQSNDSMIWAPLYVARALGYLKDEDIDIDVAIVKSGPEAMTAVNTGSAQIAMGFPATPIQAIEKGFKVKIFAELCNQFIAELVLRKEVAAGLSIDAQMPVEARIKALKGLKIATNGTGSANDYLLRRMFRDAGMNPESDVTITPVGGEIAVLAALDQKRIDGFVATPPGNVVAVEGHQSVQIIDFAKGEFKPVAGMIYFGLTAQESWLKDKPQVAAGVVRALARALALMHDDDAKAKAAVRTFFPGTPQAQFDASWESQRGSFPRTPRLTERDVGVTMEFAAQMNANPLVSTSAAIFTNEIVDLAEAKK